ncbi:MAG: integrase core domain-containing protein [Saccharofermentanales bacterium]
MKKDIEIVALRSQLALCHQQILNHKMKKPLPTPAFRQLWVLISKLSRDWESYLILIKPDTVISWHKKAFKFYWMKKSKKPGRPKISPATIALIKRIHKENPLLSPEKIHEKLVDLSVLDAPSPNTIAKYIKNLRKPPGAKQKQTWRTFMDNHSKGVWAMDFCVVPTICFKVLYVFIIISHDRRRIEHFAVTSNPTTAWVIQQIREATPYGEVPEYMIHDNDSILTAGSLQSLFASSNIKVKKTSYRSPWQNGICERVIGILRAELLNHVIPLNEKHLKYLLRQYFQKYYHTERTHQGINCQTPISVNKRPGTLSKDTVLDPTPILGGLYHSYKKAA